MEAYDVYRLYMAIKLHFTTESYDITKTKGAVKASREAFLKRRDVFLFRKLAQKYNTTEVIEFFVSNFITGDKNGGIFNAESHEIYEKRKGRMDKLSYMFSNDMTCISLEAEKHQEHPLKSYDNQHPIVIRLYLGNKISLETLIILDKLFDFRYSSNSSLEQDFIWKEISMLIGKYRPFVKFDKGKFNHLFNKEYGTVAS
jgi:hypothetical protein